MKGDLFMKRKVLVSMGMCLMLFFSFATMTQAGYVNFNSILLKKLKSAIRADYRGLIFR